MERILVLAGSSQLLAAEEVSIACGNRSRIAYLYLSRSHRQREDSNTILASQMERILVLAGSGQLLAAEEVGLACGNRSRIAYLYHRRSGSLYMQRKVDGTIAPTSFLLQYIARHISVRRQLLASEQIGLSGLNRSGIGNSFRQAEREIHGHCAIPQRL